MQIELPKPQAEMLRQYCNKIHIREEEIVRQALVQFLSVMLKSQPKLKSQRSLTEHSAFGSWRDRKQDGLAYQHRLRDEWAL